MYSRLILVCSIVILLLSCKSTTLIQTTPPNAKVYINNEYKGLTPYLYSDRKMTGSVTDLRIEKEGFEPFVYRLKRDEKVNPGAVIFGYVFILPFCWIMEYNPSRTYELNAIFGQNPLNDTLTTGKNRSNAEQSKTTTAIAVDSKQQLLSSLKNMYELKVLNNKEYNLLRRNANEYNPTYKKITDKDIIKLQNLQKMLNDSVMKPAEFETEKSKILELQKGFEIGEKVKYELPDGHTINGQIKEFRNGKAILEYTQKYVFGSSVEQVDAIIDNMSKIQQ